MKLKILALILTTTACAPNIKPENLDYGPEPVGYKDIIEGRHATRRCRP
ncbi:hypothetical protein METHB2_360003 [Candidatus Methylobacter favarea]|uniref:Uncharacterized protein n=1 Tax=Candidatus Methylobacter favarea TaxID=2707345 RepID=A0A8S0XSX1_9GAMM|nr:hypothetical protein METHB2_360003 [Candidatus Methylobacter favarea]